MYISILDSNKRNLQNLCGYYTDFISCIQLDFTLWDPTENKLHSLYAFE